CDGLQRDLAYTTVMTTLRLLENKKRVLKRIKRGRAYVYRPIVSREQMSESVLSQLKDVLFGEKLPSLMLNLIDRDRLTDADLQHLKEAVRRLEADSERGS
ncbi:MAG: BlaI/MecI/CopY family transcriptional regulator, partial [Planctomycetaceae bacterium]|nr:BlaI/MecI/CopY family transcriptional regulator [Planctomycetaceae bacterium]